MRRRRILSQLKRINYKAVYIYIVILVAVLVFAKANLAPKIPPTGEYGEIESVEVTDKEENDRPSLLNRIGLSGENSVSGADIDSEESEGDEILNQIPDYSEVNRPAYVLNDNKPNFTEDDWKRAESKYIYLSELDALGRCGVCEGSLGQDTLAGERDFDLAHVKPSGWKQAKYPDVIEDNGSWLYNRCHLLMYATSGITDDPRNLVTGTRYMNVEGQLPYAERAIQGWLVKHKNSRVLCRVKPIYGSKYELVCRGVHIEAGDVESRGEKFHVNVYCYNVQPGIKIDYLTGNSSRE